MPGETPSRLHNKRLAIRWLPSARFEQRCSSLDIWRCFRRARRVIVPPSCNNQQRRPANITPHLLPCSEATFGVSLAEPVAAHLPDNTNAPRVQTLYLLERTQAALTPLGAAVHCSAHLIQPIRKSDASLSYFKTRQPLHHVHVTEWIRIRWLAPPCAFTDDPAELSLRIPIVTTQPCAATKRDEASKNAARSRRLRGSVRRADSLTGSHKRSADQLGLC